MKAITALFLVACGAASAQQAAVATDAIEQQNCIDNAEAGVGKAALKQNIDDCRNAVKAKRGDAGHD